MVAHSGDSPPPNRDPQVRSKATSSWPYCVEWRLDCQSSGICCRFVSGLLNNRGRRGEGEAAATCVFYTRVSRRVCRALLGSDWWSESPGSSRWGRTGREWPQSREAVRDSESPWCLASKSVCIQAQSFTSKRESFERGNIQCTLQLTERGRGCPHSPTTCISTHLCSAANTPHHAGFQSRTEFVKIASARRSTGPCEVMGAATFLLGPARRFGVADCLNVFARTTPERRVSCTSEPNRIPSRILSDIWGAVRCALPRCNHRYLCVGQQTQHLARPASRWLNPKAVIAAMDAHRRQGPPLSNHAMKFLG